MQQSDSITHEYILFHILIHDGLSQATEYRSLCSIAGACCPSTLYMTTSANPKLPVLPTHLQLATSGLFSMSTSLFLLHGLTDLYCILDCNVTFGKDHFGCSGRQHALTFCSISCTPKRSHPQATVESLGQGMRRSNRWKMVEEDRSQGREESTQHSAHQL